MSQYTSLSEMDEKTIDYLQFVTPFDINEVPIAEVNRFVARLDECYEELTNNNMKEIQ